MGTTIITKYLESRPTCIYIYICIYRHTVWLSFFPKVWHKRCISPGIPPLHLLGHQGQSIPATSRQQKLSSTPIFHATTDQRTSAGSAAGNTSSPMAWIAGIQCVLFCLSNWMDHDNIYTPVNQHKHSWLEKSPWMKMHCVIGNRDIPASFVSLPEGDLPSPGYWLTSSVEPQDKDFRSLFRDWRMEQSMCVPTKNGKNKIRNEIEVFV